MSITKSGRSVNYLWRNYLQTQKNFDASGAGIGAKRMNRPQARAYGTGQVRQIHELKTALAQVELAQVAITLVAIQFWS